MLTLTTIILCSCKKETKNCSGAPTVFAGNDTTLLYSTSLVLNGISNANTGEWSIISGEGGVLEKSQNQVRFAGVNRNTYKLMWESKNDCGTSSATLNIAINIDCGNDLTISQMVDRVHWLGQSCFRIEGTKYKIYIDPQSITQTDAADIILITHSHSDHFSPTDIDILSNSKTILIAPADCNYTGTFAKRVVLTPRQDYTDGCIKIKAVPAYNITKTQYHPKTNNWVGYLITINGVTIYHAGDTERIPEMKSIDCDIAMLPLGQTYTMNTVADAAESAKDVKASVAIPMHYGTLEGTSGDAQTFKTLLNGTIDVVIKNREK